ncbi:hypothetical protein DL96DRAFT_1756053 [Flagelloscypha sp. PMI_526]|nr:hypothetical protein DL96DRAFT_1756053 [Flagelloscypha sp. PMI_526]
MGAARVQLLDDLVALMVQLPVQGTHLVIWNWKKGEIFTGCVLSLNSGMDDFTLISSNSFIVITPTGKFELYQFDLIPSDTPPHSTMALGPIPYFNTESAPSPPHLEMWKICYPTLIARYHLPALNPGHAFSSLSLSSNPVMSHPPPRGSTEYLSAEDITWDGTPLQSQSQASQDDPGSFILSESQCSGLDFEESSPDTLPQRPLPLDFRLTHPSACSRSRAMNITLGVMPGQPAAQPGQLQAQLFAHIVPAAPGAQFPLLGGPVPPQVFHGPPPAFGPPPPPLPFPLQPNGPPPPVHQHPAPAAPAHQPQQQQHPPPHGPNVVGGNPPPPHPGMLFGDGPADDGLPLLHSFVFFANLGHFLHDLEQLERQRVPLPTPPPPVDA